MPRIKSKTTQKSVDDSLNCTANSTKNLYPIFLATWNEWEKKVAEQRKSYQKMFFDFIKHFGFLFIKPDDILYILQHIVDEHPGKKNRTWWSWHKLKLKNYIEENDIYLRLSFVVYTLLFMRNLGFETYFVPTKRKQSRSAMFYIYRHGLKRKILLQQFETLKQNFFSNDIYQKFLSVHPMSK
ncbi:MAG: hypothetical protein QXQ02_02200 [Halobacteria archaeon]